MQNEPMRGWGAYVTLSVCQEMENFDIGGLTQVLNKVFETRQTNTRYGKD